MLVKFIPDRFIMHKIKHLFLILSFFPLNSIVWPYFMSINILPEHHFNCCLVVNFMYILKFSQLASVFGHLDGFQFSAIIIMLQPVPKSVLASVINSFR